MSYHQEPTRIHLALGSIAFAVFLLLVVLDALPGYEVSIYLSALLVLSYLVLLGFGVVVTRLAEARYGRDSDSPATREDRRESRRDTEDDNQ